MGVVMSGVKGTVTIPAIGLTVGEMESWSLKPREDSPPGAGEWDLRAVFSYINEFSFNSTQWKKVCIVDVGRKTGLRYLIDFEDATLMLSGRSLYASGVRASKV